MHIHAFAAVQLGLQNYFYRFLDIAYSEQIKVQVDKLDKHLKDVS